MSDTLSDLQRYWQMQTQVVLPVLGAIILVVIFYIYSLGTPTQPQLLLVDEPVTTKKEKSLARKKAKQQEKVRDSVHHFSRNIKDIVLYVIDQAWRILYTQGWFHYVFVSFRKPHLLMVKSLRLLLSLRSPNLRVNPNQSPLRMPRSQLQQLKSQMPSRRVKSLQR